MPQIKRIAKFGAVGAINTLLDFVILDVLHLKVGMGLVAANLISTTVAMLFSYFANRHLVFSHHSERVWRQIILFWVVTAFGLYVLQTGIIWLFDHPLHSVTMFGVRLVHDVGLHHLSTSFITTNGIKAAADAVTLIWNYILYKEVVFVDHAKKEVPRD